MQWQCIEGGGNIVCAADPAGLPTGVRRREGLVDVVEEHATQDLHPGLLRKRLTAGERLIIHQRERSDGAPQGREVEIACDESGFTGGSLIGGQTKVFAHASVRIDPAQAGELIRHLRARTGVPSGELKAARLLRPRNRPVVRWLLGTTSPVGHNARIHLVDTTFFVIARLLDLLVGSDAVRGTDSPGREPRTRAMAVVLYERGPTVYGHDRWQEFLTLAAAVFRTNNRWLPKTPVESFFSVVEGMLRTRDASGVTDVLRLVLPSRPVAVAIREAFLANRKLTPLFEPVIPALTRAVESWGSLTGRVSVVHDEQSALTPERLSDIADTVAARHPGRRLTSVRLVDSKIDARVQVADILAGVARRLSSGLIEGCADDELVALLHPHVDAESIWVDAGRWSARYLKAV